MTTLEAETYLLELRASDGSRTSAILFSKLLKDLVHISSTLAQDKGTKSDDKARLVGYIRK